MINSFSGWRSIRIGYTLSELQTEREEGVQMKPVEHLIQGGPKKNDAKMSARRQNWENLKPGIKFFGPVKRGRKVENCCWIFKLWVEFSIPWK